MNTLKAVGLKLTATFTFTILALLARYLGQNGYPIGQVAFARGFGGLLIVMAVYAWRRELAGVWRTRRIGGHFLRGSIAALGTFAFAGAYARLPVVDVTAISFLAPLITTIFAALLLRERVQIYRWAAVIAGFSGVMLTVAPYIGVTDRAVTASMLAGVILALLNAIGAGFAPVQIKRLSDTESTGSIVVYFSVFVTVIGLLTLPFGWTVPHNGAELMALVGLGLTGAFGQLCLTASYRYGVPSLLAPFEYASLIWAFILGYAVFGEIPTVFVVIGSLVVTAAGLFTIWRDRVHRLGAERERAAADVDVAIAAAETMAPVGKADKPSDSKNADTIRR